jgi:hypothetical protein
MGSDAAPARPRGRVLPELAGGEPSGLPVTLDPATRRALWLDLAELFFLDTEPSGRDYETLADRLKELGLDRSEVERMLIFEVAPIAGANLGYLLWPVIGEWAAIDQDHLCSLIEGYLARRARRPRWFYLGQDWWMQRMVRRLEPERLLGLL